MKKTLLTVAAAATLSMAVMPDFNTLFYNGVNTNATAIKQYRDDTLVTIQEHSYRDDGLPDTTILKSLTSGTGPSDTVKFHYIYNYQPEENTYTRTIQMGSFDGSDMQDYFRSTYHLNEDGLPTKCETQTLYMGTGTDPSINEYHYTEDGRLYKTMLVAESSNYGEPDSSLWYFKTNNECDSIVGYYTPGDELSGMVTSRSVDRFSYVDGILTSIHTIDYDKNGEEIGSMRSDFVLKESAVVQQANSGKAKAFELSLQSGRILHLTNAATAQCKLISPLGRVIRSLKLSPNGTIQGWNELTSGYYLLHVKQGQQTSVLPFVK